MRQAIRNYSHLLQMRPEAIDSYLNSHNSARALLLFVVVSLIAGLGVWGGVPNALRQLTLPEQIDVAAAAAQEAAVQVVAAVAPVLTQAQSVTEAAVLGVQEAVAAVSERFNGVIGAVLGWVIAGRQQVEQVEQNAQVQQLLAQANVTAQQVEQVAGQAGVTAQQLGELLARANVTPQQAEALLQRAGLGTEQIAQVQQVRSQIDAAVSTTSDAADDAIRQLQPLLDALAVTETQFRDILAQLSTTPEQLNRLLQQFYLAPAAIGELIDQVEATPEQLRELAASVRAEAVAAEPPIGTRPVRIVRLGGEWLSTPLRLANDWLLFALVLLLVVKLLGGRAPLPKHLGAVALAAAPLVLLIGLYIPNLAGPLSVAMAGAVHYYVRILAVVGLAWASLLLLRSLSVAHEISMWRAAGAIALTWLALYVLLPLLSVLVGGYLLV